MHDTGLAEPVRHFATDADVDAVAEGLFARTLTRATWTHAAHFAAAVWVLERRPGADPMAVLPEAIRGLNAAIGVAETASSGYHATITEGSVRAARAFVGRLGAASLAEACNALMASPLGRSSWMLEHWSRERLLSPEARRAWLEPDLKPLP